MCLTIYVCILYNTYLYIEGERAGAFDASATRSDADPWGNKFPAKVHGKREDGQDLLDCCLDWVVVKGLKVRYILREPYY